MEPNQIQTKPHGSAKDFFLNLGAIVALYTIIIALVNLLFTIINTSYPKIGTYFYYYDNSPSISLPVATIIIFFPIYIWLMWFMEKSYVSEPEKRRVSVRRWLTYITLFLAGAILAGDLVTVLYYFLDGQELTVGFLLKILVVLVLAGVVFWYYISDVREKLSSRSRKVWFAITSCLVVISIILGFVVLGSPYTQRLYKYDYEKEQGIGTLVGGINDYYDRYNTVPEKIEDLLTRLTGYMTLPVDPQTKEPYEYQKINDNTFKICAVFNKKSQEQYRTSPMWAGQYDYQNSQLHPAGKYCFEKVIQKNTPTAKPVNF